MGRMSACHGRIRAFLGACARMGAPDADDAEVRDSAVAVARYFSEAFVLHVEDEEQSILPRLEPVAACAAKVRDDHARDAGEVAGLVAICRELSSAHPAPTARARLAQLSAQLTPRILAHLELEERTMFPLLEQLPTEVHTAILREMDARRAVLAEAEL